MKNITVYFVTDHCKASCDELIKNLKSSTKIARTRKESFYSPLYNEYICRLYIEFDINNFNNETYLVREIIFVKSLKRVPPRSEYFIDFGRLLIWAKGGDIIPDKRDEDEIPTLLEKQFNYIHTTDLIAKWVPTIKHIEQNIKKGNIYTTVFWEDGSKPTVVKVTNGEIPSIYSAVAAAISIKMYGSNSAFKREIEKKFDRAKFNQEVLSK